MHEVSRTQGIVFILSTIDGGTIRQTRRSGFHSNSNSKARASASRIRRVGNAYGGGGESAVTSGGVGGGSSCCGCGVSPPGPPGPIGPPGVPGDDVRNI
jgi:hypothetical protein